MNFGSSIQPRRGAVRGSRALALSVAALVFMGAGFSDSIEQFISYCAVVVAAVLPSLLWIRMGARGIPVLQAVALSYIPYFAFPMVAGGERVLMYSSGEVLRSALTVALFLVSATIVWKLIIALRAPQTAFAKIQADANLMTRVIAVGFVLGAVYHVALLSGGLSWLGSFYGVVRTLATTFITISCFLSGIARAQGLLSDRAWRLVLLTLAIIILMAWSSLFLVGGMVFALALAFGYVIVTRRIPWAVCAVLLVTIFVLHAGKADMRSKYWAVDANFAEQTSVGQIPSLMGEWVDLGVRNIARGDVQQTALDRTSLLEMILRVELLTPETVDYLRGETYVLLLDILIPRFIDADKPASQAGMTLLNVRYGIQTYEESAVTAIGWGLVPEAYANFGYEGVFAMGILLGAFCAGLALWSARADVISTATLFNIAALMIMINIEVDFIQLFTTLLQAFVCVFAFTTFLQWALRRQHASVRSWQ